MHICQGRKWHTSGIWFLLLMALGDIGCHGYWPSNGFLAAWRLTPNSQYSLNQWSCQFLPVWSVSLSLVQSLAWIFCANCRSRQCALSTPGALWQSEHCWDAFQILKSSYYIPNKNNHSPSKYEMLSAALSARIFGAVPSGRTFGLKTLKFYVL